MNSFFMKDFLWDEGGQCRHFLLGSTTLKGLGTHLMMNKISPKWLCRLLYRLICLVCQEYS